MTYLPDRTSFSDGIHGMSGQYLPQQLMEPNHEFRTSTDGRARYQCQSPRTATSLGLVGCSWLAARVLKECCCFSRAPLLGNRNIGRRYRTLGTTKEGHRN